MPKYYCDYCDTFLTHDSPSVRKTHNGGRKHKDNVRLYYQQWMEEQAQKLVDATAKAFKTGKMPPNAPMPFPFRPPGGAMIAPPGAMGGMGPRPGMPPMRPGAFPGMPPMGGMPGAMGMMRPRMGMGMVPPMGGRPPMPPMQ